MTQSGKNTEYEVDADGIATIWLNRPHRNNAWTGRLHTEYRGWLAQAESDRAVRAIIVSGRGRSFCVGGDSDALQGHSQRGGYDPGTRDDIARPLTMSPSWISRAPGMPWTISSLMETQSTAGYLGSPWGS